MEKRCHLILTPQISFSKSGLLYSILLFMPFNCQTYYAICGKTNILQGRNCLWHYISESSMIRLCEECTMCWHIFGKCFIEYLLQVDTLSTSIWSCQDLDLCMATSRLHIVWYIWTATKLLQWMPAKVLVPKTLWALYSLKI